MNTKDFESFPSPNVQEQTFIQRVYQWMAMGLGLTGLVAVGVASNPAFLRIFMGPGFIVAALAELALVFWLTASIQKISPQAAMAGFLVYSALNGATLSYMFLAYTGVSIATTFFITAGSFAGVSLFGWVTKTDLTSLRGFFSMALIGFLLGSLVNLFFHSPVFYWLLTYAGIAIFIGLTAYDTQQLKQIQRSGGGTEQMAIIGALKLYLDFINLFLMLLRLFGRRRD